MYWTVIRSILIWSSMNSLVYMPFGLNSGPDTFQECMQCVLLQMKVRYSFIPHLQFQGYLYPSSHHAMHVLNIRISKNCCKMSKTKMTIMPLIDADDMVKQCTL